VLRPSVGPVVPSSRLGWYGKSGSDAPRSCWLGRLRGAFAPKPVALFGDAAPGRSFYSAGPFPISARSRRVPQQIRPAAGVGITCGRPSVHGNLFEYS